MKISCGSCKYLVAKNIFCERDIKTTNYLENCENCNSFNNYG
jgi:hypothetical protein